MDAIQDFFFMMGQTNIFCLLADVCHLLASLVLLYKIGRTHSCSGISGRAQILFAAATLANLCTENLTYWNYVLKVFALICEGITLIIVYGPLRRTYDREYDTVHLELLVIPCVIMAFFVNYEFSHQQVIWAFSIYLEAIAVAPQIVHTQQKGCTQYMTSYFVVLGLHPVLMVINWIFRYLNEAYADPIPVWANVTQAVLITYSCLGCTGKAKTNEGIEDNELGIDCKDPSPFKIDIQEQEKQLLIEYIQRKKEIRTDDKQNIQSSSISNNKDYNKGDINLKAENLM